MRTDRQTDGQTFNTKLIVAFRNFANAPKNVIQYFEKWNHYADNNKIAQCKRTTQAVTRQQSLKYRLFGHTIVSVPRTLQPRYQSLSFAVPMFRPFTGNQSQQS